jgi:hypothetical protein
MFDSIKQLGWELNVSSGAPGLPSSGSGLMPIAMPSEVTPVMWEKVNEIIKHMALVDKEGSKMYARMQEAGGKLSARGSKLLDELEDLMFFIIYIRFELSIQIKNG